MNVHKFLPSTKNETKNTDENLLPRQFLEKYSLPRIVTITPEEPIATTENCDSTALLNSTLLLYKQYRSGKIEAKKCSAVGSQKKISTIVIPDSYQGWFSVMTERGQIKARQYTSIQRLLAAHVTAFLIIGPGVVGYYQNYQKSTDGTKCRYQYVKTTVKSGQVLKLLAIYEDYAEQSTRSKRLSWPLLGSKQQSTQYAQCMTTSKQIVFIPITTHGYFYAVSTANNTAENNVGKVYRIADLLQVFPLPVRVCSIYPHEISGSILLESYHEEDVVLACTMENEKTSGLKKYKFLEIDINSKFFIHRVPDEHHIFRKTRVQKALKNCYVESEKWRQQLKIIHHIYPSKTQPVDSNEKLKRVRRISLGDKKTVKSASFRYSTSYGENGEFIQKAPSNMHRPVPRKPPVYLNIAHKPNDENCSSLPIQKSDRTTFENEILRCILQNQRKIEPNITNRSEKPIYDHDDSKIPTSEYSYHKFNDRAVMVTNNNQSAQVTKNNLNSTQETSFPKYEYPKYKVIKKENNFIEKTVASNQPVYKTQVMVRINDSYSVVVDSLRSDNSSSDNMYAEIDEYPHSVNNYSIFPQKNCYISDGYSKSNLIVPTKSTVNVL